MTVETTQPKKHADTCRDTMSVQTAQLEQPEKNKGNDDSGNGTTQATCKQTPIS